MKRGWGALFVVGLIAMGVVSAFAGETDLLLQKLVEKGVLTGSEAQEMKVQMQEQTKKEIAEGIHPTLPSWVQTMKLKGDFRLRYQMDRSKDNSGARTDRHRGRMRLRLGVDSKVNEKLMVGFGIATGISDASSSNKDRARSTNQSFDNSFSKHPINLDYAFTKYTAANWLSLIGGKMQLKDALWEPGDLIWDTDITPEGVAFDFNKKIDSGLAVWLKSGVFIIDEISGSNDDPYMVHLQPGVDIQLTDKISLKTAVSGEYASVKANPLENSGNSNTRSASNSAWPTGNYFTVSPAFEVNVKEPFKDLGLSFLNIPNLRVFGEYVENTADLAVDDEMSGYMAGIGLGAEKIAAKGDWQLSYSFGRLGRDAVLDILPDSDRYEGQTNMRAHELIFQYGLGKNTYLSFDVYRAQRLQGPKAPTTVAQVDWNMKF
jgi:hypothetical protein